MMDAVIIQDQRELKPSFITPTQRGREPTQMRLFYDRFADVVAL